MGKANGNEIKIDQILDAVTHILHELAEMRGELSTIGRKTPKVVQNVTKMKKETPPKHLTQKVKGILERFYQENLPDEIWTEPLKPFIHPRSREFVFHIGTFREWWGKQKIRDVWLSPAELSGMFLRLGLKKLRMRFQGKGNAINLWEMKI